jgi:hypothetical protein
MVDARFFRRAVRNVRKSPAVLQLGEPGSALIDVESKTWVGMKPEERSAFIGALNTSYHRYVDEFYERANECVERYDRASSRHGLWRRLIIICTGVVAVVNLFAANLGVTNWIADKTHESTSSSNILPLAAAVAALFLTVLANLESFYNFADRAQGYRESRELFLDAAREAQRVWEVYVEPLGSDAEACNNAVELYRRVVAIDRELRSTYKEQTKTKEGGKGAGSHGN